MVETLYTYHAAGRWAVLAKYMPVEGFRYNRNKAFFFFLATRDAAQNAIIMIYVSTRDAHRRQVWCVQYKHQRPL